MNDRTNDQAANGQATPDDLFQTVENALRAIRSQLQDATGQSYCSVAIEGCGRFNVYVHDAGGHQFHSLKESYESAVRASSVRERIARLKGEAEACLAEARRLEGIQTPEAAP